MGKRYQAILEHLREPFDCFDPKTGEAPNHPSNYDRFIIASPTASHLDWVRALDQYGKPILCEKPLSKNPAEIEEIIACKSPLAMTMQYAWLVDRHSFGRSFYDYYHHGQDGLVWDCFQIIALAKSEVELCEKSPVWKCIINGKQISRGEMDWAYVKFVEAWLLGKQANRAEIKGWHQKVREFEEKWIISQSA